MSIIWEPYLNYNFPEVTEEDRNNLEREIGHKLPHAYWEIAKIHQGQCPKPGKFIIPGTDRKRRVGVLLHIFSMLKILDPLLQGYGIISQYSKIERLYHADIVPFSDDTGGDNLAFDFRRGGEPSIVLTNYNIEGDDGITYVAPSFSALLEIITPKI